LYREWQTSSWSSWRALTQGVEERGRVVGNSGYIDASCMKLPVDIVEVVGYSCRWCRSKSSTDPTA
jgi:hypothetical protein